MVIIMKSLKILFCILFLSVATGYELFSGDTFEIELDKDYEYYSIVGNSSHVELTLQEDGRFINVTVGNYIQGSFELVFFDRDKEIITVHTSGGGGTRKIYVDRNDTKYITIDRIIFKNQTISEEEIPEPVKEDKTYFYLFIVMIIVMVLVMIYLYFMFRPTNDFPVDNQTNTLDERRNKDE